MHTCVILYLYRMCVCVVYMYINTQKHRRIIYTHALIWKKHVLYSRKSMKKASRHKHCNREIKPIAQQQQHEEGKKTKKKPPKITQVHGTYPVWIVMYTQKHRNGSYRKLFLVLGEALSATATRSGGVQENRKKHA